MRGKQIPLLLECGHSICYGCSKLYPEVSCSLCGELVQAKENKSELYPLNIYALGLVVVANHQPCLYLEEPDISFNQTVVQKTRPFQISGYCHECEIEATLRCPQCNVLYCQTCYSKNEELMDGFTKAYDDVAESLQRVLQTLKGEDDGTLTHLNGPWENVCRSANEECSNVPGKIIVLRGKFGDLYSSLHPDGYE